MLGLGNSLSTSGGVQGLIPTDISGCKFWFTYEEGLTLGGSLVNCWASQIGDFYGVPTTVTDGSPGTDRPTFNTTHVTFDGGDDIDFYDACSSGSATSLTLDTSDGGWTVFAIYTDGDWDGANQAIFGRTGDSTDYIRHDSGQPRFRIKVNSSSGNRFLPYDDPDTLVDDQYYAIMVTCAADGTITLYVDNVAQSTTVSIATTDDFAINALAQRATTDRLSGHIKHAVAYDRILTSGERAEIQSWANTYIG